LLSGRAQGGVAFFHARCYNDGVHTGDKFAGHICKCRDCAKKRATRLEEVSRSQFADDWKALEEKRDLETVLQSKVEYLAHEITADQMELRHKAHEYLLDQDR
jgi:hypothetical protein